MSVGRFLFGLEGAGDGGGDGVGGGGGATGTDGFLGSAASLDAAAAARALFFSTSRQSIKWAIGPGLPVLYEAAMKWRN